MTVKLIPLNCNHCGGPLEVPVDARFVTCSFCETRLAVERTNGTYSTAIIEQLDTRTESLASEVRRLHLRRDLDELEENYNRSRAKFMGNVHGVVVAPSGALTGLWFVTGIICAIMFIGLGLVRSLPIAVWMGVASGAIGLFAAVVNDRQVTEYRLLKSEYLAAREKIEKQLASLTPDEATVTTKTPPERESI